MPMIVPVDELVPGFVLQENVIGASGSLLLASGAVLSESRIDSLRRHGISFVRVKLDPSEESATETGAIAPERAEKVKGQLREICSLVSERKAIPVTLMKDLTKSLNSVIDAIFDSGEALFRELKLVANHDAYTYDHSWMVCVASIALARRAVEADLVKPLDYLSRLSLGIGALLHDIGKTLVPVEILNKPESLTVEEFEVMKQHPQLGLDIVRQYDCVMPIARGIVLHHHQRWDGKGYGPRSGFLLKGEEIPHLIRIASVADAYDALVSDRPYRPGSLPGEAAAILRQAGGSHLDPRFVELVEKIVADFPAGSVLLSRSGAVAIVESVSGRDGPLQVRVLGALRPECVSLVGRQTLFGRDEIVIGANSVSNLAQRVRERRKHYPAFGELQLIAAMPRWETLLQSAFGSASATAV